MSFFIASDHAGFELKNKITAKFKEIKDLGPKEFIKEDDYPDYVYILIKNLYKNINENKGILICHNGGGVCIAANKFKKIRSALTFSVEHAKSLISDDNINVICIPAEFVAEEEVMKIIATFSELKFEPQDRHLRRIEKVSIIENSSI
jgi:ribose 5-phosphate isomerase B